MHEDRGRVAGKSGLSQYPLSLVAGLSGPEPIALSPNLAMANSRNRNLNTTWSSPPSTPSVGPCQDLKPNMGVTTGRMFLLPFSGRVRCYFSDGAAISSPSGRTAGAPHHGLTKNLPSTTASDGAILAFSPALF